MLTDSQEPSAPETSVPTDSDAGSGGPTSLYRDKVLLGTVIGAFVLDQLSKRAITSLMSLGESWPAEGFFRITYGTNSGTAFGLFPNQTTLLIVVSVIAIGFLFYFYRAHAMQSSSRLSACCLLFIDVARAVRTLHFPAISVACDPYGYSQVLVTAARRHQGLRSLSPE